MHHEVVYFLIVFNPPLFLIVRVVEVPLPFCCLGDVCRVRGVRREGDGWCLEFSHGKRGERAVVLEAVHDVFRESLDVEIEGGRHLDSPRVIKDDVFQSLCGRCECWLFGGEGMTIESRLVSFDLWIFLGLGWF